MVQFVIIIRLVKFSVVVIIRYWVVSDCERLRNCGIMVSKNMVFLGLIVFIIQLCSIRLWCDVSIVLLVLVIIGIVGVCYCLMFSYMRQVTFSYLMMVKFRFEVVISVLRFRFIIRICVQMFSIRLSVMKQLCMKLWFRFEFMVVIVFVLGEMLMVQEVVKKVSQVVSFIGVVFERGLEVLGDDFVQLVNVGVEFG